MQRSSLTMYFAVVGLIFLVLCIGVIGLELVFGYWFRPFAPPHPALVDRTLAFRQRLYEPWSEVIYLRDRYGLRGRRAPIEDIELVTLGGSTTDQRYLTEGQTWQDFIHEATGIQIANAGVDGMSSHGHIASVVEWLHRIPKFHPRYYLHYIGVNDAALPRKLWTDDRLATSPWARWLRTRSAILQAGTTLAEWLAGPADIVAHGRITRADVSAPQGIKTEVDRNEIADFIETIYMANLRHLLALHRANGERAIFVSQPAHPSMVIRREGDILVTVPSIARRAAALSMINAATGTVCREQAETCRFIDLAEQQAFEANDFYDLFHATPEGARKIGIFLAQALTPLRRDWR